MTEIWVTLDPDFKDGPDVYTCEQDAKECAERFYRQHLGPDAVMLFEWTIDPDFPDMQGLSVGMAEGVQYTGVELWRVRTHRHAPNGSVIET